MPCSYATMQVITFWFFTQFLLKQKTLHGMHEQKKCACLPSASIVQPLIKKVNAEYSILNGTTQNHLQADASFEQSSPGVSARVSLLELCITWACGGIVTAGTQTTIAIMRGLPPSFRIVTGKEQDSIKAIQCLSFHRLPPNSITHLRMLE